MFLARLMFLLLLVSTPLLAQSDLRLELETAKTSGKFAGIEKKIVENAIKDPSDPDRIQLLGLLRHYQKRYDQAASLFRRVLTLAPGRTSAGLLLIETLVEGGQNEEAESFFDSTNLASSEWKDVSRLAAAGARLQRCGRSLEILGKEASPLRPGELAVRFDCAGQAGDEQEIKRYASLAGNSKDVVSVLSVLDSLYSMKRFSLIKDVSRNANPAVKKSQRFLELLALAQYRTGAFEDSERTTSALGRDFPDSKRLSLLRGAFALTKGDASGAVVLLESYLQSVPDSKFGLETYLFTLIKLQMSKKGLPASERLLRLTPNDPQALYLRGAILLQANKLDEAEPVLKKLLEVAPNHSSGCLALGLVYSATPSRFADAQSQMQKCVVIDPSNFEAYYQLGLSFRTEGKNKEAIEFISKAVEIKPDYSLANRDLGKLHLQVGDKPNALKFLKIALDQSEADPETHFQLSRLYNLMGRKELAQKHFRRFRELRKHKESGM